jgi:acetyl coenzyme A synthetase (ADP forming)-like protein
MRFIPRPAPATDDPDAHRLILRDGSAVKLRAASSSDSDAVEAFFERLTPEARYNRFRGAGLPSRLLIDRFCDGSDPVRNLTLLAFRHVEGPERVIAVAGYAADLNGTGEVAFAIDDRFQGRGLGTLLLEELAARATANGLQRFTATTSANNAAMRQVFRDSGFQVAAALTGGDLDVQLSLSLSAEGVALSERRRRLATVKSLRSLLTPSSIAVIGASADGAKIGSRILRALMDFGFAGRTLVVHPVVAAIQGLPAIRSARELPQDVDLAVVAVPAASVLPVVNECAAAGVHSLIVVSAGFAEIGPSGRSLQDALVDAVRSYGMRLLGPNCIGAMNLAPDVRMNASFLPVVPPAGRVALSSQSGALGIAVLGMARERALGLSAFVSVGNKADVSTNDLLEFWEEDPKTQVILLYLESFGNPRRFARIAQRVGRIKPIVALKAGRTPAGSRAAGSHTAALAASDTAVNALFHQSGVIRVDTIDEMFDVAECLDAQPLPCGTRVAIVTNAGGPAILAADACDAAGLSVADLSTDTQARLRACLPPAASVTNPIDMIASAGADEYRQAVEIVLTASETDAVIVIVTPVDQGATGRILAGTAAATARSRASGGEVKPVFTCVVAEPTAVLNAEAARATRPIYRFPENAVRALGRVAAYARWRGQTPGLLWTFDEIDPAAARAACRKAIATRGGGWLDSTEVADVLRAFGVPMASGALAHSADDAVASADALKFPVAAKLISPTLVHKTESGAIRLGLTTPAAVRAAYGELMALAAARGIPAADIAGVLVQPMIHGGVEVLVGVTHDPRFGPLVAFGSGGVDVEVWRDVQFRLAPLTDVDADEMIRTLRGFPLLQGHRGRAPADLLALRDLVLRISRLAESVPEIAELDLNPVMALPSGQGCRVVDARIRVGTAGVP